MELLSSPPAIAALSSYPHLQTQAAHALAQQSRRIAERNTHVVPRPDVLSLLDERIHSLAGGLIALEGPPGAGATALLCQLATTRPYAFWLPDDDAGAGLEALCCQLLALHELLVPLAPPAAGRDATTLEQLLAEAGARRPAGDPLVVVIGRLPDDQAAPTPPPLPTLIPNGVVVVMACTPDASLPTPAAARIGLPTQGQELHDQLVQAAVRFGCPVNSAELIAARAQGSFLYARIAAGLLQQGLARAEALPEGLASLHQDWWDQLDDAGRRLAMLLAAAGAPIDRQLAASLAEIPLPTAQWHFQQWQPLLEMTNDAAWLYHPVTRSFVAACSGDALAMAHSRFVALALNRSDGHLDRLNPAADAYLVSQVARHAALGDQRARAAASALGGRAWILARERHTGTMRAAADDLAWELRAAAADGPLLRLVRAAALAGTLRLLARVLPADAPADAFEAALNRGGARDATLRRVRSMLDQLPDGHDKAQATRRLGEVCFALRMRPVAMRLLSDALDMETQGLSHSWQEERENTLVAFARAAIGLGAHDTALGITARIGHAERRGMIETEVVRWLLARNQRTRAEEVAYAIGHQAMHEWAMAEVAVGHARGDDMNRADVVLSTLKTETAIAWARTELACDAARSGDASAAEQLAALTSVTLRDRALAQVVLALVAGGQPDAALAAAHTIEERAVRARALIDLALADATAAGALAAAAADITALTGDDRAPLVAALAAAQAALGRPDAALATAASLPEGEERDRAQSRIAVALARHADYDAASAVAAAIPDDDERDWALDELARILAETGDWRAAFALADPIIDSEQRARAQADLCIAWARAGEPAAAHARAEQIELPAERSRACGAIVAPLVAAGAKQQALAALARLEDAAARSRYQAALAAALALHNELVAAHGIARTIVRPYERIRGLVSVARAAAQHEHTFAQYTIGEALRAAALLGRTETFTCLELAAETLAALGGADLLLAASSAIDELDTWWG